MAEVKSNGYYMQQAGVNPNAYYNAMPATVERRKAEKNGNGGNYYSSGGGSRYSSGGGSRSTSGGGGSAGGGADYLGWYNQQKGSAEALAAQQRAAAENAYNQNLAALNAAYDNRGNLLNQNYQSTLADLQNSFKQNSGVVNQNADRSLRDAYVNMKMNQRDMPQMLAAQGISGGMSESTMADIRNKYGGARNELELARSNSLDELLLALQNSKGDASRAYNDQMAADNLGKVNQEMQLRQMLENRMYDILTNEFSNLNSLEGAYMQAMQQAVQSAGSAGQKVASASSGWKAGNSYDPASLQQNVDAGSGGAGGRLSDALNSALGLDSQDGGSFANTIRSSLNGGKNRLYNDVVESFLNMGRLTF